MTSSRAAVMSLPAFGARVPGEKSWCSEPTRQTTTPTTVPANAAAAERPNVPRATPTTTLRAIASSIIQRNARPRTSPF